MSLTVAPSPAAAAVGAVRSRLEQRPDADSRRAAQALPDVGMVLDARRRRAIAARRAGGAPAFAGTRPTRAAPAAF